MKLHWCRNGTQYKYMVPSVQKGMWLHLGKLDRHGTENTTVIGSGVQALLEVTFFAEFILP